MSFGLEGMLDEVQQGRRLLMTPCGSKDGFKLWLKTYLKLDFPDTIVDEDSTGSPLDHIWEVYHAGVTLDRSFPRRLLWYASRDSYKTLGVAVLELLAMMHMRRSVVHMGAIEQQAAKCQEYLRRFLGEDELDEFNVGNNKRTVAVVWAVHKETGDILLHEEYKLLDRIRRHEYNHFAFYDKVIVNTMASANSDHVSFFVIDEVDLIRFPKSYDEAKLIPGTQKTRWGEEQPPITILTSSRKFSGGLVQKEIDESEKTGTAIRHWNILDVTRRCPDDRHRPDLPHILVYTSDEDLAHITPEAYAEMAQTEPKRAETYHPLDSYGGCTVNCAIFAACKGRLARVTSQAEMLKDPDDTISKFRQVSVEMAKSQLMCWQPGNESSIYSRFRRKTHMLDLATMWREVTGDEPPAHLTKAILIDMLIRRNVTWHAGLDWGFTHCFAVVLLAVDGRRRFIVDAFEVPGLELNQKVELCDRRIKKFKPTCWPDPAYPADIKTFRKSGYEMHIHTKDILGGIAAVRAKLNPAGNRPPELFLLKGDPGCELLAKRIEAYKWKMDSAGRPTDVPDDNEDDLDDALRYGVQNVFKDAGKILAPKDPVEVHTQTPSPTLENWMQKEIAARSGQDAGALIGGANKKIKRGSFFCDFS